MQPVKGLRRSEFPKIAPVTGFPAGHAQELDKFTAKGCFQRHSHGGKEVLPVDTTILDLMYLFA
jgi:hypothetical protein